MLSDIWEGEGGKGKQEKIWWEVVMLSYQNADRLSCSVAVSCTISSLR